MTEWSYSYQHHDCEKCQSLSEKAREFATVRGSISATYSEDRVSYSGDTQTRTISEQHSSTATRRENLSCGRPQRKTEPITLRTNSTGSLSRPVTAEFGRP